MSCFAISSLSRRLLFFFIGLFLMCRGLAVAQNYVPEDSSWDQRFSWPGVSGEVDALLRVGDSLYIGGNCGKQIGRKTVRYLVILDLSDSTWHDPGLELGGTAPEIDAIARDPSSGDIYVGGWFKSVNQDTTIRYITMWDGTEWTSWSGGDDGLNNGVYDIFLRSASSNTEIFVAGAFDSAAGLSASGIARYRSYAGWDNLNGQLSRVGGTTVAALQFVYPRLYVGGNFTGADTLSVNNIAYYDVNAESWGRVNGGPSNGPITALGNYQTGASNWLVVGGAFTLIDDTLPASDIARYDLNSSQWSSFANGLGGRVSDIYCESRHPSRIIAAGYFFNQVYSDTIRGLAEWDGASNEWVNVGTRIEGQVNAIAPPASSFRQEIYIGGDFYKAGETVARNIAGENGSGGWDGYGLGTSNNSGQSAGSLNDISTDGERLYMIGSFDAIANRDADGIAIWDTLNWTLPPAVFDQPPYCIFGSGDTVYVGGGFTQINGSSYNHIAMWDGSAWNALGDGVSSWVRDMIRGSDSNLYVSGSFTMAGSDSAVGVAMWDGSAWHSLGANLVSDYGSPGSGEQLCLDSATGDIYLAGNFWTVAGQTSRCVARYHGGQWYPVGPVGLPTYFYSSSNAVAVDGAGQVYVGGNLGDTVWQYNGSAWNAIGGTDICFEVKSMLSDGCNVYLGGKNSAYATDCFGNAVARFNGGAYVPIGSGIGEYPNEVRSMALMNDKLYFAGGFQGAGSAPSAGLAIWRNLANAGGQGQVSLTSPAIGDTLHYGDVYPIAFTADSSLENVEIDYSLDSGLTWTVLHNRACPTRPLPWIVPDTNAAFCQLRIADGDAACYFNYGDFFTITADPNLIVYRVTRPTGSYYTEPFTMGYHQFSFSNDSEYVWPEDYYSQIDYSQWPFPVSAVTDNAINPDWGLFVDAFGKYACYDRVRTPKIVNPDRYLLWQFLKRNPWTGSCVGFTQGALLIFERFGINENITFTDDVYLHEEGLIPLWRKVVNKYWIYQFGAKHQAYQIFHAHMPPDRALDTLIRGMQLGETPRGINIIRRRRIPRESGSFLGSDSTKDRWAHNVLPYMIRNVPDSAGIWYVYVYDNNDPEADSLYIHIDRNNQTWSYNEYPDITATDTTKGFVPSLPLIEYKGLASDPRVSKSAQQTDSASWIYQMSTEDMLITDTLGNRVGEDDTAYYDEITNAGPIVPTNPGWSWHHPMGYLIPSGSYNIELSRFEDTTTSLLWQDDSLSCVFMRDGTDSTQTDLISIDSELTLTNPDPSTKHCSLIAVRGDSVTGHFYFRLDSLAIGQNDFVAVQPVGDSTLTVRNYGAAKSYSLILWHTDRDGQEYTQSTSSIPINADADQSIAPSWDSLADHPVTIYLDNNRDGVFEDSMTADIALGVGDNPQGVPLPKSYHLGQNYPNPFNPTTTIEFTLPIRSQVNLTVYNILGQKVATLVDGVRPAGTYSIEWNGTSSSGTPVATGVYFYRMRTDKFTESKKMLFLR